MNRILVVGEDALSCALGERMVSEVLPNWSLSKTSISTGGISKLITALPRYFEQALHVQPILCIADTDGKCPVKLMADWMPEKPPEKFLLRLAVAEAESWLLSDSCGAAEFFKISIGKIPRKPDELLDAKRKLLHLARLSKVRVLRKELVSEFDQQKPGVGYNVHLGRFANEHWNASRARQNSASLDRAMSRLAEFGAHKP